MRISIILPTYNESENIKIIIPKIFRILSDYDIEVIVVDDNSPDKTWIVVKELSKKYNIKLIRRPKKLGLATAILEGILNASNEICIVMDADCQHKPEDIRKLIEKILEGYDIVIGSRYLGSSKISKWSKKRLLISEAATFIAKWLFNIKVTDPLSGFFAIRKSKIESETNWYAVGYKVLLEILVRFPELKVAEVSIEFTDRLHGKSKLNIKEIINYIVLLCKLLKLKIIKNVS